MATLEELEARLASELEAPAQQQGLSDADALPQQSSDTTPRSLADLEAQLAAEVEPQAQDSGSLLRGFNTNAIKTLALPGELANSALGVVGANPAESGVITKKLLEGFKEMGLNLDENATGILDRIGREAFNGVLTAMGMRAAAPTVAAAGSASASPTAKAIGSVAEDIIAKPKTAIASSVAAAPGTVIGQEAGGQAGESIGEAIAGPGGRAPGRAVGETFGAFGGGLATGAPGTAIAQRIPGIARSERAALRTPGSAISDDNANPEAARVFATDQVAKEVAGIDNGIRNVIRQTRGSARSPQEISVNLRTRLEGLYEQARTMERNAWGRVPQNVNIDENGLQPLAQRAARILESTDNDAARVPTQAHAILRVMDDIAAGNRAGMRVSDLLEMRSGILRDARNARSGTPATGGPNLPLANNLDDLADDVLRVIESGIPGNPRLQQAREISRTLNDRFTRGPLGRLLGTERGGGTIRHPNDTVRDLLNEWDGPTAVQNLNQPLHTATNPRPPQGGRAAIDNMDEGIRASYADEVARSFEDAELRRPGSGADAAKMRSSKLARDMEPMIASYGRASTQIRDANEAIIAWARERAQLTKGALASYIQTDPDLAARQLLFSGQGDPAKRIAEVRKGFWHKTPTGRPTHIDEAADEGFKRSIINAAFSDVKSMTRAKLMMDDPTRSKALQAALSTDEYARLRRLVEAGATLETQDPRKLRSMAKFAATGMGRIIGLFTGRLVAHTLTPNNAAGSLSLPARFGSNMAKHAGSIFDQEEPVNLFAAAITNPRFERILLEQIPSNLADAKRYTTRVRNTMVGLDAARQTLLALPDLPERTQE